MLKRGVDAAKDQSYFLFSLTQEQLAQRGVPGRRSTEGGRSRLRAAARSLPVADKPDSQEICFIPDHDYAKFVTAHSPDAAQAHGTIVDEAGRVLGRHEGVHRFTVGQRKGLGLSNAAGSAGSAPVYVLALDAADQQVVVGPKASLERTTLTASGVNWMLPTPPSSPLRVTVQIRHRHQPAPATVRAVPGDGSATAAAEVAFDTPQIAVTPGQAVVFYQDDVVVGGGWIDGEFSSLRFDHRRLTIYLRIDAQIRSSDRQIVDHR